MNFLKITFILIFFFLKAYCNESINQGSYINDKHLKKIENGMSKGKITIILGRPNIKFSRDMECWCYYYLSIPEKKSSKILYRYIILYFNGNYLYDHKFYL